MMIHRDESHDADETGNYPLSGVTTEIEPGPMMFSLWLVDPEGRRAAYDFGFCWDGRVSADWQCSPGDTGTPFFEGTMTWSNRYDYRDHDLEEDDYDDLGDDVMLTYRSAETSGEGVLRSAAMVYPVSRDDWVEMAEQLFGFLRDNNLI
jgi:hypothetical protein